MNPEWIKRNLGTLLFVVVFLGLLGYSCLRLKQAIDRRQRVVADLETERTKFNGLRSSKPFPSPDNLNVLREDHARLQELYAELVGSLRRPVEVPEFNRVELAENLAQRLTEMTARVRRAEVDIPAHFAFGFDSYLGVLPPSQPDALHLLTKQLVVVEQLVDALLTCNIEQINRIRRVAVANTTGTDTLELDIQTDPLGLYQTIPFELQFVGSTKSLQTFLNELTQMPWLMLVRVVTINSQTVQVAAPAPAVAPGRSTRPVPRAATPTLPQPPAPPGMIPPGTPGAPGAPGMPGAALPPLAMMPGDAQTDPERTGAPPAVAAVRQPVGPQVRNQLSVTMRVDLVELIEDEQPSRTANREKPAKP